MFLISWMTSEYPLALFFCATQWIVSSGAAIHMATYCPSGRTTPQFGAGFDLFVVQLAVIIVLWSCNRPVRVGELDPSQRRERTRGHVNHKMTTKLPTGMHVRSTEQQAWCATFSDVSISP